MDEEEAADPILLTSAYDNTIKFWNTTKQTWECSHTVDLQKKLVVNKMQISKDRKHLICACNIGLRLYQIANHSDLNLIAHFSYPQNVTAAQASRKFEWIIAASEDGSLRLHDTKLQKAEILYKGDSEINTAVLTQSENEVIMGDQAGFLIVYDLKAKMVRVKENPNNGVSIRAITVSRNGQYIISADSSGLLIIWEANKTDLVEYQKIQAHEDYIIKIAISNDLQKIATCSADRTVKLFDLKDGGKYQEHHTLLGHTKWVWDCKFVSGSSYLITVSTDCFLKLWECTGGMLSKNCCQHAKGITCMAVFLPGEDDIEGDYEEEILEEQMLEDDFQEGEVNMQKKDTEQKVEVQDNDKRKEVEDEEKEEEQKRGEELNSDSNNSGGEIHQKVVEEVEEVSESSH